MNKTIYKLYLELKQCNLIDDTRIYTIVQLQNIWLLHNYERVSVYKLANCIFSQTTTELEYTKKKLVSRLFDVENCHITHNNTIYAIYQHLKNIYNFDVNENLDKEQLWDILINFRKNKQDELLAKFDYIETVHINIVEITKNKKKFSSCIPQYLIDLWKAYKIDKQENKLESLTLTETIRLALYNDAKEYYATRGIRGVPMKIEFKLDPHQERALAWMRQMEQDAPNRVGLRGGMLSLTMGLGKTLISIVHILCSKKGDFPTLVVTSKTVMHEWKTQGIDKFFGKNINVLFIHKDYMGDDIAKLDRKKIMKQDIVITTYDLICTVCRRKHYEDPCLQWGEGLQEGKVIGINLKTRSQCDNPDKTGADVLFCTPWERVICDESQRYANPTTKTYRYIMALYGTYKWCLTGTPIRNYNTDVWAQFRFLGYKEVTQAIRWKRVYKTYYKMHKLNEAILRMNYEDAGIVLPKSTELTCSVILDKKHREVYNYIFAKTKDAYDDFLAKACTFTCVLALFTCLRRVTISPYLILPESKRNVKPRDVDVVKKLDLVLDKCPHYEWIKNREGPGGIKCAKIREIIKIMYDIPKGEKCIVFSMFTSSLDLLSIALDYENEFQFKNRNGVKNLCPICLEDDKHKYVMPCKHTAHVECLQGLNKLECPICRESLIKIDKRISSRINLNIYKNKLEQIEEQRQYATSLHADQLTRQIEEQERLRNDESIPDRIRAFDNEIARLVALRDNPRGLEIYNDETNEKEKLELVALQDAIDNADRLLQDLPYVDQSINYVQIDGDVVGIERSNLLNEFRTNPDITVLLMTYKVGSEGLNIIEANHCIFLEPWWCPAVHKQGYGRINRRGQTRPMKLYQIIAQDTIEQRVLDICVEKDEMEKYFFDGENNYKINTGMDQAMVRNFLGM